MNPNQRTDEWWIARRGKITGSRVARVVNGGERGWATLARELANESLTFGPPKEEEKVFGAREHGIEFEDQALANAALERGFDYEQPGFKPHRSIPYLGVSSDFIFYDVRGRRWNGEIKCPWNQEIHREAWMRRQLPNKYRPQVQLQMECWGCDHTLFISYCPGHIDHAPRTAWIEVVRDQDYIDHMLERCHKFWHTHMEPQENVCPPSRLLLPKLF